MPTDILFLVTYECPRCQASLEARGRALSTWLRCPKCGRPSLPPMETLIMSQRRMQASEGIMYIGAEAERSERASKPSPMAAVRRILLAVAFLTALTLLVNAFLEGNPFNVVAFGLATIVLLAFLIFTGRRR